MHLVTLDLEGVLVPEIWIGLAEKTGLDSLRRTTRDEPDYNKLMRYRLDILRQAEIGLPLIREVIHNLDPLPGATAFLNWLQTRTPVIILSDTFSEFASPLMAKLGNPTLFCHQLEIDPDGWITNYRLRQPDQKRNAVRAFQGLGFRVTAAGDSYNDVTMLESADTAILFRPPDSLREERPDWPVVRTHEELRTLLEPILDKPSGS